MKKILLIDDNPDLRDNISEILQLANYIVIECNNGQTGIELAETEIPDLVLCDIMMPCVDGYEVLAKLKENSFTKEIPLVFLTAKTEKKDKCKGRDLGAADYITKPFDTEDLLNIIKNKILESELKKKQLKVELSEFLDFLQEIIQMTSHGVRKPVCSSLGLLQLLDDNGLHSMNSDQLEKIVEYMKTNASELDGHTRNLTDYIQDIQSKLRVKIG